MEHRGLEALVALAQHLVHHRGLHAGLLQHPERLAGLDRAQLGLVAHQGDAGDARRFGDAGEAVHLRHADQRRLVHHEKGALQGLPGPVQGPCIGAAVADIAVAGEEPLQRLRAKPGLALQCAGRTARGSEGDDPLRASELDDLFEHRRLARAGMPLNAAEVA